MSKKGYVSQHLREYMKHASLSDPPPLKVVVALREAPTTTIARVSTATRGRMIALETLREAGMQGSVLNSPNLQPRRIIAGVNTVTLQVPADELETLASSPGVEYVRPVRMHRMHLKESVSMLGVDAGVRSRFDGSGVRVAVIDSGIDADHPDLRGRVNLNLSRNFTDEGGVNDVTDGNGHGTHVAGIIGGAGATFRGVASGVEFIACKVFTSTGQTTDEGAVLAAVRWASEKGAHVINYSGGFAPVIDTALGRVVLVDPPWVWPSDLLEEEAEFKRAMDSGTVAVVSAGNEGEIGRRGTLSMPATCSALISVGSVDKQRGLAGYSSVGPCFRSAKVSMADAPLTLSDDLRPSVRRFAEVDLIAPGGGVDSNAAQSGGCFYLPGIVSALSGQANRNPVCIVENRHLRMSGTSQAAPHISGLAALILQAARVMKIDLGPRRAYAVKGILRRAAGRLSGMTVHEQGKGLPAFDKIEKILNDIAESRIRVKDLSR